MMTISDPNFEVVVAGAGPVGLMLAAELAPAGVRVLVLEQAPDPRSPLKERPFGLRGLTVPTIEALDRRDLLAPIVAAAERASSTDVPHWMRAMRQAGGHFAGIQFFRDQVDETRWPWRRAGTVPTLATDMATLERVLAERADALGVDIRRGCAVETVAQADAGVSVATNDGVVHGRWLVGCDGARSVVRKAAGIGFGGTEPEFTGYSLLLDLADPSILPPGRHLTAAGMYAFTPPGTVAIANFDGGAVHRTRPDRDQVEAVLRRVSGTDVTVDAVRQATTWTDRAFQAATYRQGRVLLAGDAAHIHAPLGGQGLNLGVGDAVNLGWKLAAIIQDRAPAGLLDSYETERAPVAAAVLDWSRAQVALMRPDPGSRALTAIVRELIATDDGATYFAERTWGVGLHYPLGDDLVIGRSVADFLLADGCRVNERLRNGHGLLVCADHARRLRTVIAGWQDRVTCAIAGEAGPLGCTALLVRPDGVVAWAGGDDDASGLAAVATRWFGAAADGLPAPADGALSETERS